MMSELLQFFSHHWILSLGLILTLALLVWEESRNKVGGFKLALSDVTRLINHEHGVIIDLRDTNAFEHGHIANALHFPQLDIMNKLEKLKKYQNKPIILVDQTGKQAVNVANKLLKQGFNKTYCLAGGLQTWTHAGLPLTKVK